MGTDWELAVCVGAIHHHIREDFSQFLLSGAPQAERASYCQRAGLPPSVGAVGKANEETYLCGYSTLPEGGTSRPTPLIVTHLSQVTQPIAVMDHHF